MTTPIENHIAHAEERLWAAMLASDVVALNELLSPDLMFTNHFGQMLGKQDDLELHRSGVLKIHSLEPSELQIKESQGLAVVSVRMNLFGTYGGAPFAGDLRFTRLWRLTSTERWQIVAAHSSTVQG